MRYENELFNNQVYFHINLPIINSFEVGHIILKPSNIYSFVYKNNVALAAAVISKMIHYPEDCFSCIAGLFQPLQLFPNNTPAVFAPGRLVLAHTTTRNSCSLRQNLKRLQFSAQRGSLATPHQIRKVSQQRANCLHLIHSTWLLTLEVSTFQNTSIVQEPFMKKTEALYINRKTFRYHLYCFVFQIQS